MLDWVRQMMGLPEGLFGVIQDTASASTLVALAAAREAVTGLDVRRRGLRRPGAPAHVRVRGGALLDREGGHRARHRAGRVPEDPGRRGVPHGRGRAAARDRRGPRGGLHPVCGDGQRGNDLHHQHRPRAGDRGGLRARAPVAARGRGLRRIGRPRPRHAARARRGGSRGLAGGEPAQVDVRAPRPVRPVHAPAGRGARRLQHPARLPAHGGGDGGAEPDGLRRQPRPPLPRPQALDGPPRVRPRGDRGADPRAHPAGPRVRGVGARGRRGSR